MKKVFFQPSTVTKRKNIHNFDKLKLTKCHYFFKIDNFKEYSDRLIIKQNLTSGIVTISALPTNISFIGKKVIFIPLIFLENKNENEILGIINNQNYTLSNNKTNIELIVINNNKINKLL